MGQNYSSAVATAREYYNSEDADNFYYRVWGGEDIHIGLYEHEEESIFDASRRTVAHMADLLGEPEASAHILDIGAGYGGAARYLASNYGCKVTALNLSEVENERHRAVLRAHHLENQVDVVDGSFESIPLADASTDIVWSQDAILHSGQRRKVLEEVARVLKSGGVFIFTDPMQTDDCEAGVLRPILDRIHLETLGSPGFYRKACEELGLKEIGFEDHSKQLVTHYTQVLRTTMQREPDLKGFVSTEYIARMKKGLQHWIDGGNSGYLCWGIFRFRKL